LTTGTTDEELSSQNARSVVLVHDHEDSVEEGTRDEILRNPKEPYTQRRLAAVPLPDPLLQRERRETRRELLRLGTSE